jgi:hypothetical protein
MASLGERPSLRNRLSTRFFRSGSILALTVAVLDMAFSFDIDECSTIGTQKQDFTTSYLISPFSFRRILNTGPVNPSFAKSPVHGPKKRKIFGLQEKEK